MSRTQHFLIGETSQLNAFTNLQIKEKKIKNQSGKADVTQTILDLREAERSKNTPAVSARMNLWDFHYKNIIMFVFGCDTLLL